jgi:RimJ/RimL family protein N-acetyltransferase
LDVRHRDAALDCLAVRARANLLLLDVAHGLGRRPSAGFGRPELVGAFAGERLLGVASLRPSILLDAGLDEAGLGVLMPLLERVGGGLVKSPDALVSRLWLRLERRGRRALLDRWEQACAVTPASLLERAPEAGVEVRRAQLEDLPALVHAARASLREESRPDPHDGDPDGFRRWVQSRVSRATVVTLDGRIGFVAYADVQRPQGWLLQGVYTWPTLRRRGLAALGVAEVCRAAFEAGADHAQLAVVEGNRPAQRLYEGLGFRPFERLRTILFA